MIMRLSAAGAGVVGLPAILAACGGDDNESSSSGGSTASGDLAKFAMQAAWVNDAEFMGYFVGMTNGYYAAEGLDLN